MTRTIGVKVSEEQYAVIQATAEARGYETVSDFLRALLATAMRRRKVDYPRFEAFSGDDRARRRGKGLKPRK